jgi:cytochrome c551/c552
MQISQGLVDAGVLAMAATDARDTEALFDAGGRIYNVCVSCHQQYIPFDEEAPELPPQ